MSGIKSNEMTLFYRKLHARGMCTTTLAERVGRARGTVTRVLLGIRRRGPVWNRIAEQLTPDEIALLDKAARRRVSHVEHCSTPEAIA
jgi:hypothetical protein